MIRHGSTLTLEFSLCLLRSSLALYHSHYHPIKPGVNFPLKSREADYTPMDLKLPNICTSSHKDVKLPGKGILFKKIIIFNPYARSKFLENYRYFL